MSTPTEVNMVDRSNDGLDRESRRPRARAVGVATGLTLAAFVASLVTGIVFAVPALLAGVDVTSPLAFLALLVAGQVGMVAVGAAYVWRTGFVVPVAVPDRRQIRETVVATVAALVAAVALIALVSAAGLAPGSVLEGAVTAEPRLLLGLAALSVVLVAPIEEFLFRGVIQGRLRLAFGPVGAVAGASLLFGSLHLANYTGAVGSVVVGALLIAVVGAVFGALYERTGNLVAPIVAHGVYNAVLFLGSYAVA
ncbi:CPBP family intramembrane glutamic endopeptidase [Halobaculum marinum]|uniref:CPBP family intramembrane glutamic endopeptidase n=1 Tax=Halobaculum marinum TaxID=3031996 RepID=A0ABD5X356_9EURY|nr:CPBP family intramembrane glutamic endopeptidase [Halobaculum sp. DT55]